MRGFGKNFKDAAVIPQDAPLWTREGGIQLGNMPTQTFNYAATPGAAGLDAASNWGGLGDTYSFGADSPFSSLNGLSRQGVLDSLNGVEGAAKLTPEQMNALVGTGDVTKSIGDTVPGNGTSLGTLANWGMGIYQGGKALKGIYDNIQSDNDLRSLKNDINLSMASNPMYDMYLDAADEKLLRQMRNNTVNNPVDGVANGVIQGLPSTALQAGSGFLMGGIPGALIGGIGGLVNSGISGYGQGNEEANAKLQGLYEKLRQAEEEYRTMKRPRGLYGAGLQSRYFNQLY